MAKIKKNDFVIEGVTKTRNGELKLNLTGMSINVPLEALTDPYWIPKEGDVISIYYLRGEINKIEYIGEIVASFL